MAHLAGLLALEGAAMYDLLGKYMANAPLPHFTMHKNALFYLANLLFCQFAMHKHDLSYLAK